MKNTLNITKLTRSDVDTETLQRFAVAILKELAVRADADIQDQIERYGDSYPQEHDEADRRRHDETVKAWTTLKNLPNRETWRHRLS